MKWIRWVLCGHNSVHRRTDGRTDGQGETSIPPFQLRWSTVNWPWRCLGTYWTPSHTHYINTHVVNKYFLQTVKLKVSDLWNPEVNMKLASYRSSWYKDTTISPPSTILNGTPYSKIKLYPSCLIIYNENPYISKHDFLLRYSPYIQFLTQENHDTVKRQNNTVQHNMISMS